MADSDKVFPALVALHRDVSYRHDSRSQSLVEQSQLDLERVLATDLCIAM